MTRPSRAALPRLLAAALHHGHLRLHSSRATYAFTLTGSLTTSLFPVHLTLSPATCGCALPRPAALRSSRSCVSRSKLLTVALHDGRFAYALPRLLAGLHSSGFACDFGRGGVSPQRSGQSDYRKQGNSYSGSATADFGEALLRGSLVRISRKRFPLQQVVIFDGF